MNDLSFSARAYIWAVLAVGAAIVLKTFTLMDQSPEQWVAFGVLMVCAAVAQLFRVVGPANETYELTPIFVFAAALLLQPGPLTLLVILCFVPEWIKTRKHWYIQSLNIAIYLAQSFAARSLYFGVQGRHWEMVPGHSDLVAAVLAAALFALINHLLLAVAVHLARGRKWGETHLFELEYFFVNAALACMGVLTALTWEANPWLVIILAAPLYLVHRGLDTPNLQLQARTDSKTGLFNSRHFMESLHAELRRASRFGRPLSVVMADMDLLRNINNSYGHLAGDVVLKGVASVIKANLREYDVAARFGGEEFALMFPETETKAALEIAERVRIQVETALFTVPTSEHPIQTTISLGVASFPAHGSTIEEVIHQADLAVYYAKLQGRNRSCASSPESRALGPIMAGRRELWSPGLFELEPVATSVTPATTTGSTSSSPQRPETRDGSGDAAILGVPTPA